MLAREEMLRKLHARDEYYRRRTGQSFAEFLRYTKPDYQLSWFHEEMAGELDQFLDDVLQKRSPRLILNVLAQEGKSEQVSRRFPAYALGRDPDLRLVACPYSATLALQFSRDVQLVMDEPNYAPLFPESIIPGFATKHNAAVRQADHFELVIPGINKVSPSKSKYDRGLCLEQEISPAANTAEQVETTKH